ncbi:MAG TPA: hypothetical protein VGE74_06550 [Gemmata sp.]
MPTRRARLGGIEVSVPNDPAAVCRRKYGPDCLTTALPPSFDYRSERPTGHPPIRVPLARIDRARSAPPEPAAPATHAPGPTRWCRPAR